jgi:tRNA dimethylallyltransferase
VRALEVLYLTGGTKAEHDRQSAQLPPRYEALKIGLFYSDRQVLYARIDERVEKMLAHGLLDEARGLLNIPGVRESTAMQAIGYKELTGVIDGNFGLAEAAELIKRGTRRYAKRQLTWFNRDKQIFWINRCEYEPQAALLRAIQFLQDAGICARA